jgi:hypothetical protein
MRIEFASRIGQASFGNGVSAPRVNDRPLAIQRSWLVTGLNVLGKIPASLPENPNSGNLTTTGATISTAGATPSPIAVPTRGSTPTTTLCCSQAPGLVSPAAGASFTFSPHFVEFYCSDVAGADLYVISILSCTLSPRERVFQKEPFQDNETRSTRAAVSKRHSLESPGLGTIARLLRAIQQLTDQSCVLC